MLNQSFKVYLFLQRAQNSNPFINFFNYIEITCLHLKSRNGYETQTYLSNFLKSLSLKSWMSFTFLTSDISSLRHYRVYQEIPNFPKHFQFESQVKCFKRNISAFPHLSNQADLTLHKKHLSDKRHWPTLAMFKRHPQLVKRGLEILKSIFYYIWSYYANLARFQMTVLAFTFLVNLYRICWR